MCLITRVYGTSAVNFDLTSHAKMHQWSLTNISVKWPYTYSLRLVVLSLGAGHLREDGAKQQPKLLKMQREDIGAGATVKRKQLHSELLQQRNQQLKSVGILAKQGLFSCFWSGT